MLSKVERKVRQFFRSIQATYLYSDWMMKCKAMYSYLSKLGSQYLHGPGRKG